MCVSNNSIEKGNKRRMGRTKLIEYFFQLLQSFLNGPTPASFIVYFWSFQTNITIFTTNICEKCPSSMWCWYSNPHPSEHEHPHIITRPGLPPFKINLQWSTFWWVKRLVKSLTLFIPLCHTFSRVQSNI